MLNTSLDSQGSNELIICTDKHILYTLEQGHATWNRDKSERLDLLVRLWKHCEYGYP
jgi:hypothetical protein